MYAGIHSLLPMKHHRGPGLDLDQGLGQGRQEVGLHLDQGPEVAEGTFLALSQDFLFLRLSFVVIMDVCFMLTPFPYNLGREEEVVNPGNTLYVTGLSTRVTQEQLEEHFSKEGKVSLS